MGRRSDQLINLFDCRLAAHCGHLWAVCQSGSGRQSETTSRGYLWRKSPGCRVRSGSPATAPAACRPSLPLSRVRSDKVHTPRHMPSIALTTLSTGSVCTDVQVLECRGHRAVGCPDNLPANLQTSRKGAGSTPGRTMTDGQNSKVAVDNSLRGKALDRARKGRVPKTLTPYEWQEWYAEHGVPPGHRSGGKQGSGIVGKRGDWQSRLLRLFNRG